MSKLKSLYSIEHSPKWMFNPLVLYDQLLITHYSLLNLLITHYYL